MAFRKSRGKRLIDRLPVQFALATVGMLLLSYILSRIVGLQAQWLFDAILGLLVFILVLQGSLFLLAQFVLPVTSWSERKSAFRHINLYLREEHGPVVFIRNGRLVARPRELQKRGPGVILLDSASAAVLRTPSQYTRVIGPGIAFTRASEFLMKEDIVDLRIQARRLTPGQNSGGDVGETAPADRRYNTHGITRDGIEISPDILVVFQLIHNGSVPAIDPDPEVSTPYGFHRNSVWRAVVRQPIDSDERERQKIIPWTELPTKLAADMWREYIRQITLDQLFEFVPGQPSPLELIRSRIQARLTQPTTDEDDLPADVLALFGEVPGPHREFNLLREAGIHVERVQIENLRFISTVESGLIRRWQENWAQVAEQEKEWLDAEEAVMRQASKNDAVSDYLNQSSLTLRDSLLAGVPSRIASSIMILEGLLAWIEADTAIQEELDGEQEALGQLLTTLMALPEI